ncbi:MAG: 16S rRNA (guanine(966)-N(2))-methyltransferase RsmD [Candidatus Latescibacteria bacterium]|nr:16S rRNA (guanine(966)-N(2))-methyltransferase RsmD [Candidatus Latescibacterota bacterium]
MIRLTGGEAKGRRLKTPANLPFRPTSGRVREAIFDLIGQHVIDACVLDLFAGSGSLGLEALGRKAVFVLFVDNEKKAVRIIRENLTHLGYAERGDVWRCLHLTALRNLQRLGRRFDLILSDPPYGLGLNDDLLPFLNTLLNDGGIAVMEYAKSDTIPSSEREDIRRVVDRLYGTTRVAVYRKT